MKFLITVLVIASELCKGFKLTDVIFGCDKDITFPHTYMHYHIDLQRFSTRLFRQVALRNEHFALSQYSIWLSLSAIAESTDGEMQRKLFDALELPHDSCYREKYYEIATSRESSGNDVYLLRNRLLILDDTLDVNVDWVRDVRESGLVNAIRQPIGRVETTNQIKNIIGADFDVNITTNAILIDSLDYHGLWTTAFDGNSTETAYFFNDEGKKIGTVDMMRMKKKVKLAYIPLLNIKILELPAGNSGRFRMVFIINTGKSSIQHTIQDIPSTLLVDVMPFLMESVVPLDVAIPRFNVTSQLDMKEPLGAIGLEDVWKEGITKYISTPPATPSTLLQRVTVTMDRRGLQAGPGANGGSLATGLALAGRQFTADRPFLYGLIDSETRTWLFSGVFSRPS